MSSLEKDYEAQEKRSDENQSCVIAAEKAQSSEVSKSAGI